MPHYFYALVKQRRRRAFDSGESVTVKIGDTTSDAPDIKTRVNSINAGSRRWHKKRRRDPRATRDGWTVVRLFRTKTRASAAAFALGVQAHAAASNKLLVVKAKSSTSYRVTDYVLGTAKAELDTWIEIAKNRLTAAAELHEVPDD